MAVNKFILIAILLGFVVSWVPRVLPFVLVKYKGLTRYRCSIFALLTSFYPLCPDSL